MLLFIVQNIAFLTILNRNFMLRVLLFFFTLNALLLPISGYAALSVSESVAPEIISPQVAAANPSMSMSNGMKCAMPNPCIDCDMSDMDASCGTNCETHCLSSAINIASSLSVSSQPAISIEIISAFKHFYHLSSSPELRPPLI